MSKISLKQGMQKQFEHIELSNAQLEELNNLQNSMHKRHIDSRSKTRSVYSSKGLSAMAATFIAAIALVFFLSNQPTDMSDKIAYEVSKNHLKLKPLEINSDQLKDLGQYLSQLDFKLVNTSILNDANWQLLGARYCSIQGNTAAQLRIKHKHSGIIETLYQAPYDAGQFSTIPIMEKNQHPLEEYSKGMGVKIWVEKGVLFALTNNNTQP